MSTMSGYPGKLAVEPLSALSYLVLVAKAGPVPDTSRIRCFRAAPGQGVNDARGSWHHPLLALHAPCDFLVIDRGGDAADPSLDQYTLGGEPIWIHNA